MSSSDSKTNSPKYTTLHLTPSTLLEILALSLTNILPSLTKLHLKPLTITFVSFAVSGLLITSIRQLSVPLLPLSFTPNLITAILFTINFLSLNYPVSSRRRTRTVVKAPKYCHITPILRSLHWLRINESNTSSSLLPTKFSQLPNLHTFITSSLFNVLVVLALHPSLLLLGHLHHPLLKLLIALFGMLHRVSRINSL